MFELYWADYDPQPRRQEEDWRAWVSRSWSELLFLVEDLPDGSGLAGAAREAFAPLAEGEVEAMERALRFVVYLQAEPGL